jgi:hypothetical protein
MRLRIAVQLCDCENLGSQLREVTAQITQRLK